MSKLDDEFSLPEESPAQISPATSHHYGSFSHQQISHHNYHRDQASENHAAQIIYSTDSLHEDTAVADVAHAASANITANSTDYQSMNSLLGNLHMMKLKRQFNVQSRTQTRRTYSGKPYDYQNSNQRDNTSIQSTSNGGSAHHRTQKKVVSLRVNSNLY